MTAVPAAIQVRFIRTIPNPIFAYPHACMDTGAVSFEQNEGDFTRPLERRSGPLLPQEREQKPKELLWLFAMREVPCV